MPRAPILSERRGADGRTLADAVLGTMGDVLYFAYGSNLDFAQMKGRCPSARSVGVAKLPGRRLAFTRWSGGRKGAVADAVADPAGEVWGVVFEITAEDLEMLDRCEGFTREEAATPTCARSARFGWTARSNARSRRKCTLRCRRRIPACRAVTTGTRSSEGRGIGDCRRNTSHGSWKRSRRSEWRSPASNRARPREPALRAAGKRALPQ